MIFVYFQGISYDSRWQAYVPELQCTYISRFDQARHFSLLSQIIMSEVKAKLLLLKEWRSEQSTTVTQALQELNVLKSTPQEQLDLIAARLADFHKEITKAKEGEVDTKWFELVIALKKKVKNLQEAQQEKARKAKQEKKPIQPISYPQSLLRNYKGADVRILQALYRGFVSGFEQGAKSPQTVVFLHYCLKQLRYIFRHKPEEALFKRVNSISRRLDRPNSIEAKSRMLANEITPRQLAEDNQETYFDEKTKDIIRKNQMAQLEENQTGFYDAMKKAINKDACEECRFCHAEKAFCEDMKQTRASDQPMTRFMRCNACNKTWRD